MEQREDWEPKIVGFLCKWCSYAGADLAGTSRRKYPANIGIIKVPCSGRVDPLFILKALRLGFDGVLVSGCHPGECHYLTGNYRARRKFAITKKFLEYLGVDPRRLQGSWVSASSRTTCIPMPTRIASSHTLSIVFSAPLASASPRGKSTRQPSRRRWPAWTRTTPTTPRRRARAPPCSSTPRWCSTARDTSGRPSKSTAPPWR